MQLKWTMPSGMRHGDRLCRRPQHAPLTAQHLHVEAHFVKHKSRPPAFSFFTEHLLTDLVLEIALRRDARLIVRRVTVEANAADMHQVTDEILGLDASPVWSALEQ